MPSPTQSIDTGNFDVKACDGERLRIVQSLIARAPSGTKMTNKQSETTRMLQYLDGSRPDLKNGMWVIGAGASNYHSSKPLAENDSKVSFALQLILATMSLPETGGAFALRRLALFLPEVATDGETLINSVQGEHMVVLNGVTHTVEIPRSGISVFQEGVGVNAFCRQRGLVPPDEFLGVVDVGGGTLIGSLFDQEGELIEGSRRIVSPANRSGVYSGLAYRISVHPLFVQGYGSSPDPQLIVQAIATNTYTAVPNPHAPKRCMLVPDRPLLYGKAGGGFDFSEIFTECNTEWWESAIKEIWGAWAQWHPRIGRVAVAGGGAYLFKALVDHPGQKEVGLYFIPEDASYPQSYRIANAVGGYALISPDFGVSHRTPSDDLHDRYIQNGSSAAAAVKSGGRK